MTVRNSWRLVIQAPGPWMQGWVEGLWEGIYKAANHQGGEVARAALRIRWAARHSCKRLRARVAELESVLQNVAQEVLEIRHQAEVNRAHGGEVNDAAATTAEGLLENLEHALGPDRVAAARAEDEAFESMLTKHHDEVSRIRAQLTDRDALIEQLKSDIYAALDEGRWDEWDRAVDTWGRASGRPDDVRRILEGALER